MTREQLLQLQQAYFDAELAVLQGKSITLNGQSMTMESLGDIRRGVRRLRIACGLWTAIDKSIHWRGSHEFSG